MGKNRLIPLGALILLLIGSTSSIYVYATQTTSDHILVNGQPYTMDQLVSLTQPRVFDELGYSGIALDDLMRKAGVAHPEERTYTLIGEDGYQKTVTWENMRNGLLTLDGQSVFSDLPKAFHVKKIVNIEVK